MSTAERAKEELEAIKSLLRQVEFKIPALEDLKKLLQEYDGPKSDAADALAYALLANDLERKNDDEETTDTSTCNHEPCGTCEQSRASLDARERLLFNRGWVIGVDFGREQNRSE